MHVLLVLTNGIITKSFMVLLCLLVSGNSLWAILGHQCKLVYFNCRMVGIKTVKKIFRSLILLLSCQESQHHLLQVSMENLSWVTQFAKNNNQISFIESCWIIWYWVLYTLEKYIQDAHGWDTSDHLTTQPFEHQGCGCWQKGERKRQWHQYLTGTCFTVVERSLPVRSR